MILMKPAASDHNFSFILSADMVDCITSNVFITKLAEVDALDQ